MTARYNPLIRTASRSLCFGSRNDSRNCTSQQLHPPTESGLSFRQNICPTFEAKSYFSVYEQTTNSRVGGVTITAFVSDGTCSFLVVCWDLAIGRSARPSRKWEIRKRARVVRCYSFSQYSYISQLTLFTLVDGDECVRMEEQLISSPFPHH